MDDASPKYENERGEMNSVKYKVFIDTNHQNGGYLRGA